MGPETLESLQKEALAEVLESYPEKVKKSRAKHLGIDSPETGKGSCDTTRSNKQTVPGVMSQRGYAYANSKKVV